MRMGVAGGRLSCSDLGTLPFKPASAGFFLPDTYTHAIIYVDSAQSEPLENSMSHRLSSEEFAAKSRALHGDLYNYAEVEYKDSHTKVSIICPLHGAFLQKPNAHLNGQGCPVCGNIKRGATFKDDRESFIQKAKARHGDVYDYSRVIYKKSTDRVEIICRQHGSFMQIASAHVAKQGCPKCRNYEKDNKRRKHAAGFIADAIALYGDRFDYSQVGEVINNKQKVTIICKEHGSFTQSFNSHLKLKGQGGCPECKKKTVSTALSSNHEEFVSRAVQLHGDRYEYPSSGYAGSKVKLPIRCKVHGVFDQTPQSHLQGAGCPKCAGSNLENNLEVFIQSLNVPYVRSDRDILEGRELDFLFPKQRLAIELNGNYWHSSAMLKWKGSSWVRNHQKDKTNECASKGIRLIHFYESDLRRRFEAVKSQLRIFLGINKEKIAARKTNVVLVAWKDAKQFLDTHHLQGAGSPGEVYGLEYSGELVAVMQFNNVSSHRGIVADKSAKELARYASIGQVQGGASKLLKAFLTQHPEVATIVSYSDRRWATGNLYTQLGFKFVHITPPDYMYASKDMNGELQHKSSFRRAALAKKYPDQFDPALSERENCHKLGFYQIFNCGLTKWRLDL